MQSEQLLGNASRINALTQEQRDAAQHHARARIAGAKPTADLRPELADFERTTQRRFPPAITRLIYALCVLMLVAAFLPSAMRLHEVARAELAPIIRHAASIYIAALCIVLMAETGQVIFSLAVAIAGSAGPWLRAGLIAGAVICTLIALVGNAAAASAASMGLDAKSAFRLLETFAPPVLVLITAQVLKTQMLHAIEDRHAANQAYMQALAVWDYEQQRSTADWQMRFDNAHEHADWMRVYANALRDALVIANRQSRKVLRDVNADEWRDLVHREMNAEQWYLRADARAQVGAEQNTQRLLELDAGQSGASVNDEQMRAAQPARNTTRSSRVQRSGASAGRHTRELDDAVTDRGDGTFVGVCPRCTREFVKDSADSAKKALSAHIKGAHKHDDEDTQEAVPTGVVV